MTNDVAPLAGYPEAYGLLLAVLQDGTNEWRWELEPNLGPEVTTWRIQPGGRTIGAVMLHMLAAELFWFEKFALGREPSPEDRKLLMLDEINVDEARWPDPPSEPLSWYFDLQDRYRSRSLENVRSWPAPDQFKDLHGMPRSMRWALGHVVQHEAYHGGQIVMLYDLYKSTNVW